MEISRRRKIIKKASNSEYIGQGDQFTIVNKRIFLNTIGRKIKELITTKMININKVSGASSVSYSDQARNHFTGIGLSGIEIACQ